MKSNESDNCRLAFTFSSISVVIKVLIWLFSPLKIVSVMSFVIGRHSLFYRISTVGVCILTSFAFVGFKSKTVYEIPDLSAM